LNKKILGLSMIAPLVMSIGLATPAEAAVPRPRSVNAVCFFNVHLHRFVARNPRNFRDVAFCRRVFVPRFAPRFFPRFVPREFPRVFPRAFPVQPRAFVPRAFPPRIAPRAFPVRPGA
jgi:hypothetical protein